MSRKKRRRKRSTLVAKHDAPSPPEVPDSAEQSLQARDAVAGEESKAVVHASDVAPESPGGIVIQRSERFQGPVPHPNLMAGYEEVLPGSADRILTMAEQSATHIRKMQERGQISSVGITVLLIVLDAWREIGLGMQPIWLVAGIYVFSRLPAWWHSWRRPPIVGPEADQDRSGPEDTG